MKKYFSLKFRGIVVVIFSLVLISSSVLVSQGKRYPMEFKWDVPDFENDLIVKIEENNEQFVKMLEMLSVIPQDQIKEFIKMTKGYFKDTYLKNPTLTTEDGQFNGWNKVIPELKKICEEGVMFQVDKVYVNMNYKGYDKAKKLKPEKDIDYEAHIKTEFSSPESDPSIEGDFKHRRPCIVGT